jgi:hypothetical protein
MATFFDVVTVTCFVGLVIAFFQFTDRNLRTLVRLLPAAISFAIANQVGNKGADISAIILILAGAGYALLLIKR